MRRSDRLTIGQSVIRCSGRWWRGGGRRWRTHGSDRLKTSQNVGSGREVRGDGRRKRQTRGQPCLDYRGDAAVDPPFWTQRPPSPMFQKRRRGRSVESERVAAPVGLAATGDGAAAGRLGTLRKGPSTALVPSLRSRRRQGCGGGRPRCDVDQVYGPTRSTTRLRRWQVPCRPSWPHVRVRRNFCHGSDPTLSSSHACQGFWRLR
jgi:hypothetical protein